MAKRQPYHLKKAASGTWFVRVTVKRKDGTTDKPSRHFKLKRDARDWALQMLGDSSKGVLNPSTRLDWLFDSFLASKPDYQAKTRKDYRRTFDRFLAKYPDIKVEDVTRDHVRRFIGGLTDDSGKALSNTSKKYAYAHLKAAFRFAVAEELLARVPMPDPPSVPASTVLPSDVLSRAQLRAFLKNAREEELYPLILLLTTTGLRVGEALALTGDDIDANGVLRVSKTLQHYDRTKPVTKPNPKSEAGNRDIKLTPEVLKLLPATGAQRLFPHTYQKLRAALDRTSKRAELDPVRPHVLRHTACTAMLNAGVPVKTVSTTMGHRSAAFTLDTYAKFLDESLDDVPRAWDRILGHTSDRRQDQPRGKVVLHGTGP